jgi:MoaA/NifB/PqqE/SkfB family radical SAM enzyme
VWIGPWRAATRSSLGGGSFDDQVMAARTRSASLDATFVMGYSVTVRRSALLSIFVDTPGQRIAAKTADRIARVVSRRGAYARLAWHTGLRLGPAGVLRTQFPLVLPDAAAPPTVSVEFTNYCNLRCPYCTSPLKLRAQGFMSEETLADLVRQLRECGRPRVRLVGNGEATLHPRFAEFVRALGGATRMLTLTTNGQWRHDATAEAILDAPTHLVEISVDGMTREHYERSRPGGDFERLLRNLVRLRELRGPSRRTLINIRVMLRPSEKLDEPRIMRFWRAYADTVMSQYIIDVGGNDDDVYAPVHATGDYPRCTLPFKVLDVHWNGNVPLCSYSGKQTGQPEGLLLGNIRTRPLEDLWNDAVMSQYRRAHRTRDESLMPVCNGCFGS